ncbi:MAG: hypothetical protein A2992_00115 [Elusimicrobia bacterium RIFCSPLOWO2_01_FULL_59_12]|nr:MAG: hypothetical protein A2992_00115 [Elusimicrobia bacterium RIFCSPLOWO2_01_FULL_59_12]
MGELHQLHFIELMIADQPHGVPAIGSRFPPEAGAVADILFGQVLFLQDLIPVDIGHGDLRGGYQIKGVPLDPKELFLKAGELPGPLHGLRRDQVGGHDFRVSVLLGMDIQHERDQRPLQRRPLAAEHGKARAREFGRGLEVKNAQGFP